MKKFETTDIIRDLRRIVDVNTFHYKTDFSYDVEVLCGVSELGKEYKQYKSWFWISRKCGTNLYPEALVYEHRSTCYESVLFWLEDSKDNKAYIVDIKPNDTKGEKLEGVIYELDKEEFVEHIKKCAFRQDINGEIDADGLASFLKAEKSRREKFRSANFDKYIEKLKRHNKKRIEDAEKNPGFYSI